MQNVLSVNGVHIGKEGHLFLASGAHAVFDYALGEKNLSQTSLDTFAANLSSRRKWADEFAVRYLHMIVPDKQSVLSEWVEGAEVKIRLGEEYRRWAASPDLIYPLDVLRTLGAEAFMRTDTHLAARASILLARIVFRELTGEEAEENRDGLEAALTIRKNYVGDLGVKLDPPRASVEKFLNRTWGRTYSNNLTANDGLVDLHVNLQALRQGRLLIFGDSFARGMGAPLSRLFSEVIFLRSRFLHPEMIWLARPDYMLTQNVERYLAIVAPDSAAPPFFLYPDLPKKGEPSARCDLALQLVRILRSPLEPPVGRFADNTSS